MVDIILNPHKDNHMEMLDHAPNPISIHDIEGFYLYVNAAFSETVGYTLDDLRNRSAYDFFHPEDLEAIQTSHSTVKETSEAFTVNYRFRKSNGEYLWFETLSKTYKIQDEDERYIICYNQDITHQKIINSQLEAEQIKYKSLVDDAHVGVYRIQYGKLVYVNPRLEEITGYSAEELYEMNFINLFVPEQRKLVETNIRKRLNHEHVDPVLKYNIIRKDKNVITLEIYVNVTTLAGVQTVTGTAIDVTARRKAEEKVKKLAYLDPLTELPNRISMERHFHTNVRSGLQFAVLFIDMDRFKFINDSKGHKLGDQVLKKVTKQLLKVVSYNDSVFRYSGDEFIVMLPYQEIDEITHISQSIIDAFSQPLQVQHQEIFTTPSIGISLYEKDGHDHDHLLQYAEVSMYATKSAGGNGFTFYNSEMNEQVGRKLEVEFALRKAIVNNEFTLHYQPQYTLSGEKIIGAEALIRWHHPDLGFVSPAEFIPIAEKTGLIIPIGQWVMETACKEFKKLSETHGAKLSINVSSIEISQPHFLQTFKQILEKTGFPPSSVVIELTERIMSDGQEVYNKLEELTQDGIRVSIDDFGTGYSSLSILHNLPIDSIKIDKSFVDNMMDNSKSLMLIRTIIDLGTNFEYEIVAEGIEEKSQIEKLKTYNESIIGQGYYYNKPMPIQNLKSLFE